jgi:hypothetical protein
LYGAGCLSQSERMKSGHFLTVADRQVLLELARDGLA